MKSSKKEGEDSCRSSLLRALGEKRAINGATEVHVNCHLVLGPGVNIIFPDLFNLQELFGPNIAELDRPIDWAMYVY